MLYVPTPLYISAPSPVIKQSGQPVAGAADLPNDPRLRLAFSLKEKCVSAEDVVKLLARECNVSLHIESELRPQKLRLRLTKRSAGDVLAALAELLQCEWQEQKGGDGYNLMRTPEAKRYAARWWKLLEQERAAYLRESGAQVEQAFRTLNPKREWLDASTDPVERASDERIYHNQRFWQTLPTSTQKQVAASFDDKSIYRRNRYSSVPSQEGGIVTPLSAFSSDCRGSLLFEIARQIEEGYPIPTPTGVHLFWADQTMVASATLSGGEETGAGTFHYLSPSARAFPFSLDQKPLLSLPPDAALSKRQAELLEYQRKTVWQNDPPEGKGEIPDTQDDQNTRNPRLPRFGDIFPRLAEEKNTEYLADYYSLPERLPTDTERKAKFKEPFATEMNRLAALYDVSWRKQDGGIVLMRHNRWYREDGLEVPLTDAQDIWNAMVRAEKNTPPLLPKYGDELYRELEGAAIASARLSRWQLPNGLRYFTNESAMPKTEEHITQWHKTDTQPCAEVAETVFAYPNTCAFYASLPDQTRRDLLTVGTPVSDLAATQREMVERVRPTLLDTCGVKDRIRLTFTRFGVVGRDDAMFGNRNHGTMWFRLHLEKVSPVKSSKQE